MLGRVSVEHFHRCLRLLLDASRHPRLWAELYLQEERQIRTALGPLIVDVQHIGSTSVPGIQAKPILDILVGLQSFEQAPQCIPLMESIGYEYAPQAGIPNDFVFGKAERRTHLAHLVEYGGSNWQDNLRFRDRLREDISLAQEYEALKLALGERYPNSRANYTEGKTAFIQRVLLDTAK